MTRTALALSPHLDDAAFSAGGTLVKLAAEGWRVVVATVFTATVPDPQGFALACQTDKGLGPEVDYMALRRGEDRQAMAALGAEGLFLPFPEAPHRGYDSAPALFAGVHAGDRIGDDLEAAFARLAAEHDPELLLAPQSIGGHADHILVTQALRRVAGGRPVLWWTDFPYTLRADTPKRPFAAEMEALEERVIPLDAPFLSAKRDACRAYRSQLGYQFGGADGLDKRLAENGPMERFRAQGAVPTI
ncbi:PIG-L deacetylase family protein [Aureimonas leprariae]|uniref:PIG-L family deacetylase n=1 Tax=Plantimonas leprariae TaxID=2615207 RepID=A0A7V7PRQ7_9HYPH|nr:PIG-L family deacetylase [Aureimonas leprariae]KAB0681427.1 PIG-L family deacetylase [Aureimonas leprariae]